MALTREQIEYDDIRKFFFKRRNRFHTYIKKCMNKYIRLKAKKINLDDTNIPIKRKYKGWEY